MKHFLALKELAQIELSGLIEQAIEIKKNPQNYSNSLPQKTLLMIFEQPSVRTHLSFDVAMQELGGHAIFYDLKNSTLGKKETISDFSRTVSRYVQLITARLNEHSQLQELARSATVPVINAMTNFEHPCQGVADFQTIFEKKGKFKGLTLAYVGDANNNVTHSLLFGGALLGMNVAIGCPKHPDFIPKREILDWAGKTAMENGAHVFVSHNPLEAVQNADIVYTDSWMSYRIPAEQEKKRVKWLKPFQVNSKLLAHAPNHPLFMHCLPAHRGKEVTDEVMDSEQSIVFDQTENRLHSQKAVLLWLSKQKDDIRYEK